ncbi:MAG: hypothetical protein P4L85_21895 [Paludisphaera borealis]|uniref:hypothetical protein n=1 Tax=Paludisphaera borealis TaxID=1387353 RepID=UPI002841B165|nr:hypothetical protein [Paludisphaera borealis]MDR3622018.1 hypothetical protein [Paludisphaera borealis]
MILHPYEEEMTRLHGPPEEWARKNREAIDDLLRAFTEPGLRGLLVALSRLEEPRCAHWLSEFDLATTPLDEMINPYDFCGRHLEVESAEPPFYTVAISMGFGNAGDGGCFRVKRDGDAFTVVDDGENEICIF